MSFALADGTRLAPTDLKLTLRMADDGAGRGGSLAFTDVDLRPLAGVAAHLPLPPSLRQDIADLEPHGSVRNGHLDWTGNADAPIVIR